MWNVHDHDFTYVFPLRQSFQDMVKLDVWLRSILITLVYIIIMLKIAFSRKLKRSLERQIFDVRETKFQNLIFG